MKIHRKVSLEKPLDVKQKREYNINKVRYWLQVQFGVIGFNFYAKYHLSSLFENNKGPENLNVIYFGIIFEL